MSEISQILAAASTSQSIAQANERRASLQSPPLSPTAKFSCPHFAKSSDSPASVSSNIQELSIEPNISPPFQSQLYSKPISYWNYIRPTELLSLQSGREGQGLNHHDEHLFIIVHQVFELWFKQMLHDLRATRDWMIGGTPALFHCASDLDHLTTTRQLVQRATATMRLATQSYDLLDRMNPASFLAFRDILGGSSGFQSFQLREIEILVGLKDHERIPCEGQSYRRAFKNAEALSLGLDQRLDDTTKETTLKQSLSMLLRREFPKDLDSHLKQFHLSYLEEYSNDFRAKEEFRQREIELVKALMPNSQSEIDAMNASLATFVQENQEARLEVRNFLSDSEFGLERLQILWIITFSLHQSSSKLYEIIDALIDLERSIIQWRQRHARTVEYFIGRKRGTGHSTGVEYIEKTSQEYRVFADIWKLKTMQISSLRFGLNG